MPDVKRVVVIEGDDAAPEAMTPAVALLKKFELPIEWLYPSASALRQSRGLAAEIQELIDSSDTTFFGSTSGGQTRNALFYLRWVKETYANFRPCRYLPGYRSPLKAPEGIDLVIVRENLEDLYVSCEGELDALAGLELMSRTNRKPIADLGPGRFALKVLTEKGCEQVVRAAFELCQRRKVAGSQGKLTAATKHNMLPRSDGFFREIAIEIAKEYEEIEFQSLIVDDFAHRLVAHPHDFDVVVTPNLYGDILSDAASGLLGGLGVAASGCYGDSYAYFESVHGTAPDIAGKNIINPTASLLSAGMMLRYLGFEDRAGQLEEAIAAVYARGLHLTPDQGGQGTTTEFVSAVEAELFP